MVVLTGTKLNLTFYRRLVTYLQTSSSFYLLNRYWQWFWIGIFRLRNLISYSMSLSGGKPEHGLKVSGNSLQMAYQWDESAVGTDIECKLDDDMPSYFAQSSFFLCILWSGPGSTLFTCREMLAENVVALGVYASCIYNPQQNTNLTYPNWGVVSEAKPMY